jgi:hypothetical protein
MHSTHPPSRQRLVGQAESDVHAMRDDDERKNAEEKVPNDELPNDDVPGGTQRIQGYAGDVTHTCPFCAQNTSPPSAHSLLKHALGIEDTELNPKEEEDGLQTPL